MMNQQIDLLKSILFAEWTTLVTFGICLLVLQKQKKPAYQLYTRARQLLAINFLIFAMEPFLYWLKEEEIYSIPYPETISLSVYLIVTVLLSMIYLPFVQPDYITRKRVLHNVIFLAGCLSFLCIGAIIGGTFRLISHITVTVVLLTMVILLGIRFYSYYRKAQQKMANFYTDNFKQSIAWLARSVTLVVALGFPSYIPSILPHWGIEIYKALCLLSIIYMFLSFTNYMFNANFVVLNITLPQKNVRLDKGTIEKLQRCTLRWQKTLAALTKNITINDVSRQLGTNRTYLSLYLNTYLNLTFSEWIGQIRLKQAKILLASNAIMSMEQVAEATGFTSSSAFSHYFKAHEGLSPIRWRRQTRHKKTDQSD